MVTHQTRKRRTRADGERSYRRSSTPPPGSPPPRGSTASRSARLAGEIGMSKSGLYAHFDSKQDLQLATVGAAQDVFTAEVVAPATKDPEGLARLETLCERFLSYVERGVFPGGCFFLSTAAEWDTRDGPIRDQVRTVLAGWTDLLEANVREAQQRGELAQDIDSAQLIFEINALLHEANGHYLLFRDAAALDRARKAIDDRLARAQR